jgi:hypothetical protein
MGFEGVKWLENNLETSMKDNIYDFLLREASV